MYTEYFGLTEKPFELTPNPSFLYLTEVHKEGLAHLKYGVLSQKGFVLLTGEVGTGKTTLLHSLISEIRGQSKVVFLANPIMTAGEFRSYIVRKLGLKTPKDKTDFLVRMEWILHEYAKAGRRVILIVDEAQKLSSELMEEIRLLSNIETSAKKLITILLVGQPEVLELLSREESRALRQRIGLRYHLKPLSLEETQHYIGHRLMVAGALRNGLFDAKAYKTIYRYSQGFPRIINILCDHAMLTAYARGDSSVNSTNIQECASELNYSKDFSYSDQPKFPHRQKHSKIRRWLGTVLMVVFAGMLAAVVGFVLYRSDASWVHSLIRTVLNP